MKSNRRAFILNSLALGAAATFPISGGTKAQAKGRLPLRGLAELKDVSVGGELGTRYQAATCNLLARQVRGYCYFT